MSGFLSRKESPHDVFGAGHSSTSLSAALGISWAKKKSGDLSWTVAVIGDGGLTAGLALEALNNLRSTESGPLLIVLNDNQMSISPNAGAIPAILQGGRAKDFFTLFDVDFIGPVNGHSISDLLGTFAGVKQGYQGKPVVVHVLTEKGKGYAPAEESPAYFHGVGPIQSSGGKRGWSHAFGEALVQLAEKDPRIVAITAAMPEGTGLQEFQLRFPDRFFDVGIAEPHAVTFAAGLAVAGYRPVVAIYSTFLQRGLDQIIHDIALQGLGVTFVVDRAGFVGADGPTHHGAFDLSYLGMIPDISIHAPANYTDLAEVLALSIHSGKPTAIRFPRGEGALSDSTPLKEGIRKWGESNYPRAIVAALGPQYLSAREWIQGLSDVVLVGVVQAKPTPQSLLEFLERYPDAPLLTIESGARHGGWGEALTAGMARKVKLIAYEDRFFPHGLPRELEASTGISREAVRSALEPWLS